MTTNVDPIDPNEPGGVENDNATSPQEASAMSSLPAEDDELSTEDDDGGGRGVPPVQDKK